MLVVWWFSLIIGTNFLLLDTTLINAGIEGNTTLNTPEGARDTLNFSSDISSHESTGIKTFKTAVQILFGFTVPDNFELPSILVIIISFINWIALVLTIVTVYKLVNPLSSG